MALFNLRRISTRICAELPDISSDRFKVSLVVPGIKDCDLLEHFSKRCYILKLFRRLLLSRKRQLDCGPLSVICDTRVIMGQKGEESRAVTVWIQPCSSFASLQVCSYKYYNMYDENTKRILKYNLTITWYDAIINAVCYERLLITTNVFSSSSVNQLRNVNSCYFMHELK